MFKKIDVDAIEYQWKYTLTLNHRDGFHIDEIPPYDQSTQVGIDDLSEFFDESERAKDKQPRTGRGADPKKKYESFDEPIAKDVFRFIRSMEYLNSYIKALAIMPGIEFEKSKPDIDKAIGELMDEKKDDNGR